MEQRAPRARRTAQQLEPEPEPEPVPRFEDWGAGQGEYGSADDDDAFFSDDDAEEEEEEEEYSDEEGGPDRFGVTVISVGGRQYRKQTVAYVRTKAMTWDTPEAAETYGDEPSCAADFGPAQSAEEEMTGSYKCPPQLFKFFVGKGGATKKQLEESTGCTLTVPGPRDKATEVGIRGPTEAAVDSAVSRLAILAVAGRQKLPPTHFLSVPLGLADQARKALAKLCKEAKCLGQSSCEGFEDSMVTEPSMCHLTLVVLTLLTAEEVAAAVSLLQGLAPELRRALHGNADAGAVIPHTLELAGVEIMNDDPAMVDVLYISIADGLGKDALLDSCRLLVDALLDAALITREDAEAQWLLDADGELSIKLHATLVNTVRRATGAPRRTFDARPMLAAFAQRHVAAVSVDAVHLSCMGNGRVRGYYKAEASIDTASANK